MGCSKKQGQLEPSPLNVTQAAGHKARWREETKQNKKKLSMQLHVTSFSSISYYSNVRLISKIELEQNFQSITLHVHASANERPPLLLYRERTSE